MHMPSHMKDILIGLLVAYVVIDLLLAYATRSSHSGLMAALSAAAQDENIAVVVVLGLGAGFLAYYLARNSSELFSTKKDE